MSVFVMQKLSVTIVPLLWIPPLSCCVSKQRINVKWVLYAKMLLGCKCRVTLCVSRAYVFFLTDIGLNQSFRVRRLRKEGMLCTLVFYRRYLNINCMKTVSNHVEVDRTLLFHWLWQSLTQKQNVSICVRAWYYSRFTMNSKTKKEVVLIR